MMMNIQKMKVVNALLLKDIEISKRLAI